MLSIALFVVLAAPANAATWKVFGDVSRGPAGADIFPRGMAVDAKGRATVAFHRYDLSGSQRVAGSGRIMVTERAPGDDRFSDPYEVPVRNARLESMLVAPDGRGALLYTTPAGDCMGGPCPVAVRVSLRGAGGRFGAGEVVADGVYQPSMAMDDRGRPTVTWVTDDVRAGTDRDLFVAERVGSGWRTKRLARALIDDVTVAVGPRGDAVVAWTHNPPLRRSIDDPIVVGKPPRAVFRRAGGKFGGSVEYGAKGTGTPAAAGVDAAGNVLLVTPRGSSKLVARYRRAGGKLGGSRTIATGAQGARVLMAPNGDAVVTYSSGERTHARQRIRSGAYGPAEAVGPARAGAVVAIGQPLLAMVFEHGQGDAESPVRAYVRRASGGFAEERLLTRDRWEIESVFAANARGHAIAAWTTAGADQRVAVAVRTP
jgi:hypothetical protein